VIVLLPGIFIHMDSDLVELSPEE